MRTRTAKERADNHVAIMLGLNNTEREKLYNEIGFGLSLAAHYIKDKACEINGTLFDLAGTVEFEIESGKMECLIEAATAIMKLRKEIINK